MAENLLIVESPAKANTIKKYLGKTFDVKSSFGHIRDLSKKNFGVDVNNNFKPSYILDPQKKKVIKELKDAVKTAKMVWLASDEDREGEAIAWHLAQVLKLNETNSKRIVFNEITKKAVTKAIEEPRTVNQDIVDAQQARRILDRLVGFELSQLLWKKVKGSLSAGRVQSVAVKLLVEREREIMKYVSTSSYKVVGVFSFQDEGGKIVSFKASLKENIKDKKEAIKFANDCIKSNFKISSVETKPSKRKPSAPFTTSTLQQEASRKLGFSVSQTMSVAQKLYEAGKITYMRTDSVSLSNDAIENNKEFILENFGDKYLKIRRYKTKSKGAQEAHEAIRPSSMVRKVSSNSNEQRLYDLIFNRTLASQMADAIFDKTTVTINISEREEKFIAKGEVLKFAGFLKAYNYKDEDSVNEKIELLPPLKEKQDLDLYSLTATERFTHHPARYTEASLVKKLEELGIGRPSTYAPIISTIQKRGYVVKEDRDGVEREYNEILLKAGKIKDTTKTEIANTEKKKLFPTDIGMVVNDFLSEHFEKIMDFNFTATVEKDFDKIANGKIVWHKMLNKFYTNFHKIVETTTETAERNAGERQLGKDPETGKTIIVRIAKYGPVVQLGTAEDTEKPKYASLQKDQHLETITLEEALKLLEGGGNGRLIGEDPESGREIYARIGKFGPLVQMGKYEDTEKPRFANLQKGQTIDNLTLEQALKLFELPRNIGTFEEKDVTIGVGRFGPFVLHDKKFVSLKKTDDPMTIELERAIELIKEKRQKDIEKHIKSFPENPDLKIIKDRWNRPCVHYKKKYYRIDADTDPTTLTEKDCMKIAGVKKDAKKTTKKKAVKKKTTAKKTTTKKKK